MAPDDDDAPAEVTPGPGAPRGAEPPTRWSGSGWALLAILAILAAVLVAVVVQVDIDAIADTGWRENALWAVGAAVALLGLGLAALAWTVGTDDTDSALARGAVLAAVLGVVGAVVVVGLADEQGGELASAPPAPESGVVSAADGSTVVPDAPLGFGEALDAENLTSVALPVEARTLVTLELTPAGRELLAGAMSCRAVNLRVNGVIGTAIGGTWAQPLVVVSPPFNEDGDLVTPCRRALVRLPVGAGVARPGP